MLRAAILDSGEWQGGNPPEGWGATAGVGPGPRAGGGVVFGETKGGGLGPQ